MLFTERRRFEDRAARLSVQQINRDVTLKRDRLEQVSQRLANAQSAVMSGYKQHLESNARLLQTLGYTSTLERGYAVVRSGETVVTSKADAEKATHLEIQFADGVYGLGGSTGRRSKTAQTKGRGDDQGSLF